MDAIQSGERHVVERVVATVLACAVALPLLVLLVTVASGLSSGTKVAGDAALVELYTLRATTGEQILGPYSRFGFHHPGPLVFYCLAPFYLALGRSYAALCVGALALNLASLVGIALVVRKVAGPGRWPLSLAVLGAYVVYLQPALLVSAWNPDIAILPFAFALVASAAVMAGHIAYLPAAVFAASFAAQSHLTCAGPVACVALLSLAALIVRRGRRSAAPVPSASHVTRHVIFAATIAVVVWLPPLIEQVRDDPGNMTLILRYLREGHGTRPLGSSLLAVATQASGLLLAPFGVGSQARPSPTVVTIAAVLAAALGLLLVFGILRARHRRDAFVLAACGSSACLLVVALVQTLGVAGTLHAYLVRWISAVGLLGSIGIVGALAPPRFVQWRNGRLVLAVCAVVVAALAALGLRDVLRFPGRGEITAPARPDLLSNATIGALGAHGVRRPQLRILSHRGWEQAAGIVVQCTKAGRPPSVDAAWLFMFGEPCRFDGVDDGVVLVTDSAQAAQLTAVPGVELVAKEGEDSVLLATIARAPADELHLDRWEADIYLRGGFSGPESEPGGGYRWSNGPASWVVLPASPGPHTQLRLLACPLAVAGAQQELTVEVNGYGIARVGMKPGWASYAFPVPSSVVQTRNVITFRYSFVRSPFELEGTGDRRLLAVRFRTISLSDSE